MSYHTVIFSMPSASTSSSSSLSILPPTSLQLRLLASVMMWEVQLSLRSVEKHSKKKFRHSWGNSSIHLFSTAHLGWRWLSWSRYPSLQQCFPAPPGRSKGFPGQMSDIISPASLMSRKPQRKAPRRILIRCWTTSTGSFQHEEAAVLLQAPSGCLSS